MIVYRITLEKWSTSLQASGFPARWNSKGNFVIYTSASKALACLENIVHRSGEGLNKLFKVMKIEIPENLPVEKVDESGLPDAWQEFTNLPFTQEIGDAWISQKSSVVLEVPSVIIPGEFNYIINQNHQNFKDIKLLQVDDFIFDSRLNPVK
ncbi:MAG: RES domain-containing protein [Calditrichaeota bacterium]|nr:MAG: RES domain-containing protein [Calditrichota bacterium]MBL1205278.1 RES domain-containing protein [Calditrichota bacterium]NOG45107.1 RES family NAD+ phosphorylase [Calditrichota bacterium]